MPRPSKSTGLKSGSRMSCVNWRVAIARWARWQPGSSWPWTRCVCGLIPRLHSPGSIPQVPFPRLYSSGSTPQALFLRFHSPGSIPQVPLPRFHSSGSIPQAPFLRFHSSGSIPQALFPRLNSSGSIPQAPFLRFHSPGSIPQAPFPRLHSPGFYSTAFVVVPGNGAWERDCVCLYRSLMSTMFVWCYDYITTYHYPPYKTLSMTSSPPLG